MICLYCRKEKPTEEFSKEHILPRAVGGNLDTKNPFLIGDVCNRCNNLCGLFVDAPFVKSWFIHNQKAEMMKKHSPLTDQSVYPLVCMGMSKDAKYEGKICDLWIGLTGDVIYHFHEPYPEEKDVSPVIGIPPTQYNKKLDPSWS